MAANTTGSWGGLLDWPLIGIHAILTSDGKVLSFGTNEMGHQGGFMYDVWDPVTNTHMTLDYMTPTDIFCAAAIQIPGTDQIIITGGDARPLGSVNTGVADVNVFDSSDGMLMESMDGDMVYQRWYPTTISLTNGQVLVLGGTDINGRGIATPEIYTPGEGWRALTGATNSDLASAALYPRAFVRSNGEIVYLATGTGNNGKYEVYVMDPAGNGSVRQVATVPFAVEWDKPAIMYEAGKVLMLSGSQVWSVDLNGEVPVFTKTGTLDVNRSWSNLAVLADGSVVVTGGSSTGNDMGGVQYDAAIWNPATGQWSYMESEAMSRLYHSTSLLLPDGSILSLGGGAPGPQVNTNGQIFKPPYLFDSNGNPAVRPVITDAPATAQAGDTITITVDNAAAITKLTMVKNGATTHALNMDTRMVNLSFTVGANNTIAVKLPPNSNELTAGSWMLFAFNNNGTPSVSKMMSVEPTGEWFDGVGDLGVSYFNVTPGTSSLAQINFDAAPIKTETVTKVDFNTTGSVYAGGAADNVAAKYSGAFLASKAGSYTFYLTSDDGAQLYIDGVLVVNNDGLHAPVTREATVALSAGSHAIEIRYFEATGGATLDLDWKGPGFERHQMTFDGAAKRVNGTSGADDIEGTMRAEYITGGDGDDNIHGGAGNDIILGQAGNDDCLCGGAGNDRIDGGTGNDVIEGGAGADILIGGDGVDTVKYINDARGVRVDLGAGTATDGSGHIDTLSGFENVIGSRFANTLIGDGGANRLNGGGGNDILAGGSGNDTLIGGTGSDRIDGGDGNDTVLYTSSNSGVTVNLNAGSAADGFGKTDQLTSIENVRGSAFADSIRGDASANFLVGGDGSDMLYGGGGDDTLEGGAGNDAWLNGEAGNDIIRGGEGDDWLRGGNGNDIIDGGLGNDWATWIWPSTFVNANLQTGIATEGTFTDTLIGIENLEGGWGNDILTGNDEANVLVGNDWNDTLTGAGGSDTLNGGNNDDRLVGGTGTDWLTGGTGADIFRFDATPIPANSDAIYDFAPEDTIELENAVFTGLTQTGVLSASAFVTGAAATSAEHRIVYNSATGVVFYDADGSGDGAAVQFAYLANKALLTSADFLVT